MIMDWNFDETTPHRSTPEWAEVTQMHEAPQVSAIFCTALVDRVSGFPGKRQLGTGFVQPVFCLTQYYADLVDSTVIDERNFRLAIRQRLAIQFGVDNSATDSLRILDRNFVARGAMPERDFKARPPLGYARRKNQDCAL